MRASSFHILLCVSLLGCSACASDTASKSASKHSASQSSMSASDGGTADDAATSDADRTAANGVGSMPDVEFTLDVHVPAGAELLRCVYAAFPSDRGMIAVNSAESHYTAGSHHFLAYRSDLVGIPEDRTEVFDCNDNDFSHNRGSYYEAQQPDSSRALPAGVAHMFQPDEVVILQAHYINATDEDVDAHVRFVLHTVDPAEVKHEAGSILWSNFRFSVPPHSKQRVTLTCPIPEDFNPALLWSHMHHRSSNFVASTDDEAAAEALGTLYEEHDWAEPQPREYQMDPAVTLHAGSSVTFSCDMTNDTDSPLVYGNSAETNEMCILHGMYWPRMTMRGAEFCFDGTAESVALE